MEVGKVSGEWGRGVEGGEGEWRVGKVSGGWGR